MSLTSHVIGRSVPVAPVEATALWNVVTNGSTPIRSNVYLVAYEHCFALLRQCWHLVPGPVLPVLPAAVLQHECFNCTSVVYRAPGVCVGQPWVNANLSSLVVWVGWHWGSVPVKINASAVASSQVGWIKTRSRFGLTGRPWSSLELVEQSSGSLGRTLWGLL